jgi:8-oxo-dGTP diphosphatase
VNDRSTTDYDPRAFPPFAVTVDIVVLSVDESLSVLLVQRGLEPYVGWSALPGGFVQPDESVDDAAHRELREETGITNATRRGVHLEQLATFGEVNRDPRMRVVSAAYLALTSERPALQAGTDASEAAWVDVDDALAGPLAFDHADILRAGVERARSKLEYTTLATALAGPDFTLGELQHVYEVVWGQELQRANFRRKVLNTPGFVEATRTRRQGRTGGAPATVYRPGPGHTLTPPMMRDDQ